MRQKEPTLTDHVRDISLTAAWLFIAAALLRVAHLIYCFIGRGVDVALTWLRASGLGGS